MPVLEFSVQEKSKSNPGSQLQLPGSNLGSRYLTECQIVRARIRNSKFMAVEGIK